MSTLWPLDCQSGAAHDGRTLPGYVRPRYISPYRTPGRALYLGSGSPCGAPQGTRPLAGVFQRQRAQGFFFGEIPPPCHVAFGEHLQGTVLGTRTGGLKGWALSAARSAPGAPRPPGDPLAEII